MNSVNLVGRLTKEVELRYVPSSGRPVATFSLAVDRPYKDADGNKRTDFFQVQVWGKIAENVANYTEKGSLVAITGALQTRNYKTQNGEKRYITEIIASSVQFLSNPKNKQQDNNENQSNTQQDIYSPEGLDEEGYQDLEDGDYPF